MTKNFLNIHRFRIKNGIYPIRAHSSKDSRNLNALVIISITASYFWYATHERHWIILNICVDS